MNIFNNLKLSSYKTNNSLNFKVKRDLSQDDIFEKFENFLQSHDLVAKAPLILSPSGPLGALVPRSFQPEDIKVPLAATGKFYEFIIVILYRICKPIF